MALLALPPGDSATCGDIGGLTVNDRDYPQALLLSGTQRARRPLRPELAVPLGVCPPSQLAECAVGYGCAQTLPEPGCCRT
jgi:hypothetical protein